MPQVRFGTFSAAERGNGITQFAANYNESESIVAHKFDLSSPFAIELRKTAPVAFRKDILSYMFSKLRWPGFAAPFASGAISREYTHSPCSSMTRSRRKLRGKVSRDLHGATSSTVIEFGAGLAPLCIAGACLPSARCPMPGPIIHRPHYSVCFRNGYSRAG
jgi:hypothetical protein